MESEIQARVNIPVVLVNREGLYVIIAVLGVSILGCAGVLTYSFSNYAKLKRNAEEVRNYIASRVKAADQLNGGKQVPTADVTGDIPANERPANGKAMIPQEAHSDHAVDASLSTTGGSSEYGIANGMIATVASHKMSATKVDILHSRQRKGAQSGDSIDNRAASTGNDSVNVANRR
ncbi:hypothetical protein HPB50_009320 [Hyalomma asiaticum]|uniref:Uncharacterized protein n=1 Tax=Hyalomma asiaticum TaxID=266040 RepID=A0ACB7SLZ8_HYAAI|nr:hypothetical protein HPB50_009320 [Hyalomma asiaticum]